MIILSKHIGIAVIINKFINLLCIFSDNLRQTKILEISGIAGVTYAEIIIALGTIGIVALNTIPTVAIETQRNLVYMQLQRDYSIYANGINKAIIENGTPDTWGLVGSGDPTGLTNINTVLSGYFKMTTNCNTASGCFPDVRYKNLKGIDNQTILNQDSTYTKFKLADGSSIAVTQWSANCSLDWGDSLPMENVCGLFITDINGDKSPNIYGRDVFGFALTKYGLVPLGTPSQSNAYPFNGFCNRNSNANFKYENGLSCTAWIMYNQNMDYLDCQGLNWGEKTSCG